MSIDYNLLIKRYIGVIEILRNDEREVSNEVIQILYDEIEDIQIILGNASQIQPKMHSNDIGFEVDII